MADSVFGACASKSDFSNSMRFFCSGMQHARDMCADT
jgi:hypothetical protein